MNRINGDSYIHLFMAGSVAGDMDEWFGIPAPCSLIVAISCDPGNAYFTDKDPVAILALNEQTNSSLFSKRCNLS